MFLENGNLASAAADKSIKLWDPSTGQMLAEFKGRESSVIGFAQPQNGWLASGSSNGSIHIWNLEEKKVVNTLIGHRTTSSAAIAV